MIRRLSKPQRSTCWSGVPRPQSAMSRPLCASSRTSGPVRCLNIAYSGADSAMCTATGYLRARAAAALSRSSLGSGGVGRVRGEPGAAAIRRQGGELVESLPQDRLGLPAVRDADHFQEGDDPQRGGLPGTQAGVRAQPRCRRPWWCRSARASGRRSPTNLS